jgi:hypothetical protein
MVRAVRGACSIVVVGAIGALALTIAPSARAAESVRLAWSRGEGADACLDEGELATRVRARLASDPFDDAARRVIEGHAVPVKDGFRADLIVRGADGAVLGRRTIETPGADCSALGQAVTLAVVLTIDPNAPLSGDESTASFPIDRPPEPAPSRPSEPAPPPNPPPRAPTPPCPSCPPESPRVGLDAGITGVLGLLPRAALGAEIEGTYPMLPSGLLVGARFLPSVDTSDGHLAIGLMNGKVGYSGALIQSRFALSLFGVLEAGVTTVVARDLTPVNPGDYAYVGLAAGPRIAWPVRSAVQLHASLAGLVPFTRQRFEVDGSENAGFQASSVGAAAFLGIGLGG